MRIVSWNVNGLRACVKKGFLTFLNRSAADVIGLQEVRALPHQLDLQTRAPNGWHTSFVPAERPGYSGVAIYSRQSPDRVESSLNQPLLDAEGRLIIAHFGRMAIASVYFPKGSGKDRDNSRVPYKLEFYAAVFDRIQPPSAAWDSLRDGRLQHGPTRPSIWHDRKPIRNRAAFCPKNGRR